MKQTSEFEAFSSLVSRVLSVPKTEILRREAAYQREAAKNPARRGPKRKAIKSPVVARDPDASPRA